MLSFITDSPSGYCFSYYIISTWISELVQKASLFAFFYIISYAASDIKRFSAKIPNPAHHVRQIGELKFTNRS